MGIPNSFDDLLHNLSGVQSFQWFGFGERSGQPKLRIHTKQGRFEFSVEIFRSHLSQDKADHIAGKRASGLPRLILAPAIGSGLSRQFVEAGLSYLDARGNCHFDLGVFFVHIEGLSGTSHAAPALDKGIRRAGYQVLFAYLADPELLNAPIREVASVAGVSRQPVSTLRRRLIKDKFLVETKSRTSWRTTRELEALNLWLGGYKTVVRSSLLQGTYRTRELDPLKLERELEELLADRDYAWGGAAAAYRQTQHYRGETTVIHGDLGQALGKIEARPASQSSNLLVLGHIGEIRGTTPHLAHPLLVYSELYQDPNERAREAAQVYYEKFLGDIGA